MNVDKKQEIIAKIYELKLAVQSVSELVGPHVDDIQKELDVYHVDDKEDAFLDSILYLMQDFADEGDEWVHTFLPN